MITTDFEPYEGREDDLQKACIRFFKLAYRHKLIVHIPNGGKRNPKEAAKFKALGVLPGMPDILIFEPRTIKDLFKTTNYNGLAIELKTKTGQLSEHQKERIEELTQRGWLCKVVRSLDEFIFEVEQFLD